MNAFRLQCLFVVATLWALAPGQASAGEPSFEAFFGSYVGRSVASAEGDTAPRDLSVHIEESGDGFKVDWATVRQLADGSTRRRALSIVFQPTKRSGIYGSAMRSDKFGHRVPLDPLKGDPYVWAKIQGRTLTVYALVITEEGGYEMQVYERTLTESGLDLRFARVRNGLRLKLITGTLTRQDE